MAGPTPQFWQDKFTAGTTPWDRGAASPKLSEWLGQSRIGAEHAQARARVAVPGCGAGHEVVLLAQAGLDVTGIDYAPAAVERSRDRLAAAFGGTAPPHARIVQADVLAWSPAEPLDAVYEQTCLCALHPDHWVAYGEQLHLWLRPGGLLLAVLMQVVRPSAAHGAIEGPPYHCDINAVRAVLPERRWEWPRPPYDLVPHPMGAAELAVVLVRR